MQALIKVPANAPLKGVITITPISTDINGQDGSSTPGAHRGPCRLGAGAEGDAVARHAHRDQGHALRHGDRQQHRHRRLRGVRRHHGRAHQARQHHGHRPDAAPVRRAALNFSPLVQGKKVRVRSFAYDGGGRLGYSVRSTSRRGYLVRARGGHGARRLRPHLPAARSTATARSPTWSVDRARGNVFLSNLNLRSPRGLAAHDAGLRRHRRRGRLAAVGHDACRARAGAGTRCTSRTRAARTSAACSSARRPPPACSEDLANRLLTRVVLHVQAHRGARSGDRQDPHHGLGARSSSPIARSTWSRARRAACTSPPSPRLRRRSAPCATSIPPRPRRTSASSSAFATPGADPNSWLVANIDARRRRAGSGDQHGERRAHALRSRVGHHRRARRCVTSTLGIQRRDRQRSRPRCRRPTSMRRQPRRDLARPDATRPSPQPAATASGSRSAKATRSGLRPRPPPP